MSRQEKWLAEGQVTSETAMVHGELDGEILPACARRGARAVCFNVHRQHFGKRRAGPSAFRKRPAPAEHDQAAAALADEIGEHAQLFGRERGRFDAAEDNGVILEQILHLAAKRQGDGGGRTGLPASNSLSA